jgi:FKBP-type peptidyl-prolyl cis-trans isomerase FkpA
MFNDSRENPGFNLKFKMRKKSLFLLLAFPLMLASCGENDGFNKTKTGLNYKHHLKNDGEKQANVGDYISVNMVYKTETDSVLFDSRVTGQPMVLKIAESDYEGDIFEGLAMMALGDSSSFMVDAEAFFTKNVKIDLPEFIQKGSKIKFDVKLVNIQSVEDIQREQDARLEKFRQDEIDLLNFYLQENNISQTPTSSGLFYVETIKGKGKKAENGKMVKVNYTGKLIDGTVFDTSIESEAKKAGLFQPQRQYIPLDFELGAGQVIRGWEEGISYMNVGGKATLIIPSTLAYGPSGAGGIIEPYSTLIFEVELVDVK